MYHNILYIAEWYPDWLYHSFLWSLSRGTPFLFNLSAEVLTQLIFREESQRCMKGDQVSREGPRISHLMYADDVLLFAHASHSDAVAIRECLEDYVSWSGQFANLSKSTISFNPNTPIHVKQGIHEFLHLHNTPTSAKYLGLPLF